MNARVGRPDEGQALVEFALVAPIFLLLLFAIIQLGLLFGGQNTLVNAVRETARYAAPYRVISYSDAMTTCPTVAAALQDDLNGSPLTADTSGIRTAPTITYSLVGPDPDGSYHVEVNVSADFKFPLYVPLVAQFLDGMDGISDSNLRLSAEETMRVENGPIPNTTNWSPLTYSCS
jgi:Flp pilus assembly protein TadG